MTTPNFKLDLLLKSIFDLLLTREQICTESLISAQFNFKLVFHFAHEDR